MVNGKKLSVVIAGSRSIKDYDIVEEAIANSGFDIGCVISGTAYGVDKVGEEWAANNNIPVQQFPANWKDISHPRALIKYGQSGPYNALAGIIRNEEMAEVADAAIIVWDGESTGSAHMYKLCQDKGIPVWLQTVDLEAYKEEITLKHRSAAVEWAKEMREDKDAVVIDTEFNGASKDHEIIGLGIVRLYDGEVLFNSLIKPSGDVKFNWYATQVHGITESHLRDAPRLVEVYDDFKNYLDNKNVLAYNVSADRRMIEQTIKRYSLKLPPIKWHCIMSRYAHFSMKKNVKLSAACAEMSVKAGNHDAAQDALAGARVVWRISQDYICK